MPGNRAIYGCPHCGNKKGFKEANVARASSSVDRFDETGRPSYTLDCEIDWSSLTIDRRKGKPYQCEACGNFSAHPARLRR
jgi:predicted RNA-binding Zn-ribbon protein involved in translation (DUF1610 family)